MSGTLWTCSVLRCGLILCRLQGGPDFCEAHGGSLCSDLMGRRSNSVYPGYHRTGSLLVGSWKRPCRQSAGLGFFTPARRNISSPALISLQAPILFVAVWSLLPFGKVVVDDLVAWRQFPLLSGFETPLEQTRWSGTARRAISYLVHAEGCTTLRIDLGTQRYSASGPL